MLNQSLQDIVDNLATINKHLSKIETTIEHINHHAEDHEQRVRALEKLSHRLFPLVTGITFLIGCVTAEAIHRLF